MFADVTIAQLLSAGCLLPLVAVAVLILIIVLASKPRKRYPHR